MGRAGRCQTATTRRERTISPTSPSGSSPRTSSRGNSSRGYGKGAGNRRAGRGSVRPDRLGRLGALGYERTYRSGHDRPATTADWPRTLRQFGTQVPNWTPAADSRSEKLLPAWWRRNLIPGPSLRPSLRRRPLPLLNLRRSSPVEPKPTPGKAAARVEHWLMSAPWSAGLADPEALAAECPDPARLREAVFPAYQALRRLLNALDARLRRAGKLQAPQQPIDDRLAPPGGFLSMSRANFRAALRGCPWSGRHTMTEQMAIFDTLPRELRDVLNDESDGNSCVHCIRKLYRRCGLEATLAALAAHRRRV